MAASLLIQEIAGTVSDGSLTRRNANTDGNDCNTKQLRKMTHDLVFRVFVYLPFSAPL